MPIATSSQTIGPFWHLIDHPEWADVTRFGAAGEVITVHGVLTDGDGAPVTDACVEIWQSDPPASDIFPAFGRAGTDPQGEFRFTTVKPGPVAGRGNAMQAPHLAISIFARGLLHGLATRLYFEGDELNETDPLLSSIEDAERRATLVAVQDGPASWRLDIRLQGDGETVFLEI